MLGGLDEGPGAWEAAGCSQQGAYFGQVSAPDFTCSAISLEKPEANGLWSNSQARPSQGRAQVLGRRLRGLKLVVSPDGCTSHCASPSLAVGRKPRLIKGSSSSRCLPGLHPSPDPPP